VRGLASHFVWTRRSKESLTLDLKHAQAAALLKRLIIEQADVPVQNLAPGAAARLGLSFEALSAAKPELIVCDISMLEALGEWMGIPLYDAFDDASPPPRSGASHATIHPCGPFPAGDGKTVMLGRQNEREWLAFCDKVLLQPALAQDARFTSNSRRSAQREALHALIVEAFATLTAAEPARLECSDAAVALAQEGAQVQWDTEPGTATELGGRTDGPAPGVDAGHHDLGATGKPRIDGYGK